MDVAVAVLVFASGAVLAMVLSEVHEGASYLARVLVRRSSERLSEPMRSIRREEWDAEIDALEGLHLVRLAWTLGHVVPAAWKSPSRLTSRQLKVERRLLGAASDLDLTDSKPVIGESHVTMPSMVGGVDTRVPGDGRSEPVIITEGIDFSAAVNVRPPSASWKSRGGDWLVEESRPG